MRDKLDLGIVVSWRRRESGRWPSGPAGWWRWTGRLRPGGRGRGPRPAGTAGSAGWPPASAHVRNCCQAHLYARQVFPALASRSLAASASAAPRSRSGRSAVLWSCRTTVSSVVMDASVKFVIIRYYHEFYSLRPRPAFVLPPGATLPSRRPSGRTSHPRGRPGCLRGSIYWVLLSRGWFSVSKPL